MIKSTWLFGLLWTMVLGASGCSNTSSEQPSDEDTGLMAVDIGADANSRDMGEIHASDTDIESDSSPELCVIEEGYVCRIQGEEDLGDCSDVLGYRFDGAKCVPLQGCGCDGESCPLYSTLRECARSCAAQGNCRTATFAADIPIGGRCGGMECGLYLFTCIASLEDPTNEVSLTLESFDRARCTRVESAGDNCGGFGCAQGSWCCESTSGSEPYSPKERAEVCALTLDPEVSGLLCF